MTTSNNYMYSLLTNDRSGARILDMLYCYSYCLQNGITYKGACDRPSKYENPYMYKLKVADCVKLCKFLGLPDPNVTDYEIFSDKSHIFARYTYVAWANNNLNNTLNDEFRRIIYNECKKNLTNIKKDNEYVVAVHIRRGDVDKNGRWFFRYTSNNYYIKLIKRIKKKKRNCLIYVFSESCTDDPFTEFRDIGCIMKLDTDLREAWNYFIQSDLFIMASSAFSIVPAIYRPNNNVIYVENKYFQPLAGWICGTLEEKLNFIDKNI